MNPKTTILLVVALAVAICGVWWAQSSSQAPAAAKETGPQPLYPNLAAADITKFALKSGSEAECAFEKVDDKWRMTAPMAGPSQHYTVSGDVSKVANLKYVKSFKPSDADPPTPEMTSLDNPARIVKLTEKNGDAHVLSIGARQMLSNKTYVQKEGDDAIYLVDADLNRDLDRDLADYRGVKVAEFTTADAVEIQVSGTQNFTLAKHDDKWTIESPFKARADASPVNSLLSAVSNLSALRFVDDRPQTLRPYGLDNPRLVVAVTTEKKTPKESDTEPLEGPTSQPDEPEYEIERRTVRVAFGGGADKKVFAKLDDPGAAEVFEVAEDVMNRAGPALGDLRDKKIVDVPIDKAQRIKLTAAGDSIDLVKQEAEWKIASALPGAPSDTAEFAAVDDLLKALRDLKATGFEEVEARSHGFDAPRSAIEVAVEGQVEPVKITVGGESPSKTAAYVRNDREGFIAAVPAEKIEPLIASPIACLSREILQFPLPRASKLEISRSGGAYMVERQADGWAFTSPISGTAELPAVTNIVRDLSDLRGRRVAARSVAAGQYGLQNPAVRVSVTVDAETSIPPTTQPATQPAEAEPPSAQPPARYTLAATRHASKVYAMLDGGALIYEIDEKVLQDLEAELFVTKVTNLEPSEVRRIAYAGDETFTFEKQGDSWKLAGEATFQIDPTKITQFLNVLRDLRLKHFVSYTGAELQTYGLDQPAVSIDLASEGGKSQSLMISGRGPGSDRYAHTSDALDRVFLIGGADMAKLRKKIADFQKAG